MFAVQQNPVETGTSGDFDGGGGIEGFDGVAEAEPVLGGVDECQSVRGLLPAATGQLSHRDHAADVRAVEGDEQAEAVIERVQALLPR